jgi:hypothetical protein
MSVNLAVPLGYLQSWALPVEDVPRDRRSPGEWGRNLGIDQLHSMARAPGPQAGHTSQCPARSSEIERLEMRRHFGTFQSNATSSGLKR